MKVINGVIPGMEEHPPSLQEFECFLQSKLRSLSGVLAMVRSFWELNEYEEDLVEKETSMAEKYKQNTIKRMTAALKLNDIQEIKNKIWEHAEELTAEKRHWDAVVSHLQT